MALTIKARGIVKPAPNALVRVGFPMPKDVARRIRKLTVVEGDTAEAGALLAELDHEDLKASLEQLRADMQVFVRRLEAAKALMPVEVRVAESAREERKAQLDYAAWNFDRLSRLLKEDASAQYEREVGSSELAAARARFDNAEATAEQTRTKFQTDIIVLESQIAQARAAMESLEVQIRWSALHAPISGQVFAVHQRQGELTSNQPNAPVLTLLDPTQLQLHLYVDEADFGGISIGQGVSFRIDAHPDQTLSGRVARVLPQPILQENVVYYLAIVEVAEPQRSLLRPEMTALAFVGAGANDKALLLPLSAVRSRPGGWYVLRPGVPTPVEIAVQIGWKDEGRVEIREGLSEGDEVALEP
jgi:HlyD family secretion protein/macrolide-specific efflux system membrane fusion protein